MRSFHLVAEIDRESFELLISFHEVPFISNPAFHFQASVVGATLGRIYDECLMFISGLQDAGDGFGLELFYDERSGPHRPIFQLCLVDGPMTRDDTVERLLNIMSTAETYLQELEFGVENVNWKVEGF